MTSSTQNYFSTIYNCDKSYECNSNKADANFLQQAVEWKMNMIWKRRKKENQIILQLFMIVGSFIIGYLPYTG